MDYFAVAYSMDVPLLSLAGLFCTYAMAQLDVPVLDYLSNQCFLIWLNWNAFTNTLLAVLLSSLLAVLLLLLPFFTK